MATVAFHAIDVIGLSPSHRVRSGCAAHRTAPSVPPASGPAKGSAPRSSPAPPRRTLAAPAGPSTPVPGDPMPAVLEADLTCTASREPESKVDCVSSSRSRPGKPRAAEASALPLLQSTREAADSGLPRDRCGPKLGDLVLQLTERLARHPGRVSMECKRTVRREEDWAAHGLQ